MTDQVQIQGHTPDSKNEINVAAALNRLGFSYIFQYQVGLQGTRGSQIIDFLVYTIPKPTPLFVHGRHWHSGKHAAEDELKMSELVSQNRNRWAEPVIIWDDESETVEDAIEAVKKALMI